MVTLMNHSDGFTYNLHNPYDMDLQFERIQSGSHRHLQDLLGLYLESFPNEERRTTSDLLRMLNVQEMYFTAVMVGEVVVGFVVYWKFSQFRYIEHLAIYPEYRRKGFGAAVLQHLQREGKPLLLEVEIPQDVLSTQRVDFTAGPDSTHYRSIITNHLTAGRILVPMLLFSDRTDWDAELLKVSRTISGEGLLQVFQELMWK